VPPRKGSGRLPIPFLFCKIDRFCRVLVATNQVLRSDKKPSVSVDSIKSEIARAFVENLVDSEPSHDGEERFH